MGPIRRTMVGFCFYDNSWVRLILYEILYNFGTRIFHSFAVFYYFCKMFERLLSTKVYVRKNYGNFKYKRKE